MSKKGRHRCSPHKITDLELTPDQKVYVTDIGFGCLNHMLRCELPAELTWWLVSKVNCDLEALLLGDKLIPIQPLVSKLLGIPKGTLEVTESSKCTNTLKQRYTSTGRGKHVDNIEKEMKGLTEEANKDNFCISFMLFALAHYLAPNTTLQANRDFLGVLEDVSKIKEFNWCAFVARYLIHGIKIFQTSNSQYVHGCVHILHLIYFDFLHMPNICDQLQTPRIHYVREEDLHDLQPLGYSSKVLKFSETLYAEELSGYAEEISGYPEETNADGTSDACKIFENFANESNSAWDQLVNEHMLVTKQISEVQKASEDLLCKLQKFKVTFNAKLHSVAQLILKNGTNMARDKSDCCLSPNDDQRGGEHVVDSSPNDDQRGGVCDFGSSPNDDQPDVERSGRENQIDEPSADANQENDQHHSDQDLNKQKVKVDICYQRRRPLESKAGEEATDESKNKDIQEPLESKTANESNEMVPEDTEEICSIGSKTLDKIKRKKRAKVNYNEDYSSPIQFKAKKDAMNKIKDKPFVFIGDFFIHYDEFLKSLCLRGHIDNMVMSVYVELFNLENEVESTPTSRSKFSFSPNFTCKLKSKDLDSGMRILESADKKHKLKHKDLLLLPIVDNEHWVLVCINLLLKQINFFDSVGGVDSLDTHEVANTVIESFITLLEKTKLVAKDV